MFFIDFTSRGDPRCWFWKITRRQVISRWQIICPLAISIPADKSSSLATLTLSWGVKTLIPMPFPPFHQESPAAISGESIWQPCFNIWQPWANIWQLWHHPGGLKLCSLCHFPLFTKFTRCNIWLPWFNTGNPEQTFWQPWTDWGIDSHLALDP